MSVEEVTNWLEGIGLSEYQDIFIKQGYDDLMVVAELNEADLNTLDIKPGHRKKILLCSAKLKQEREEGKPAKEKKTPASPPQSTTSSSPSTTKSTSSSTSPIKKSPSTKSSSSSSSTTPKAKSSSTLSSPPSSSAPKKSPAPKAAPSAPAVDKGDTFCRYAPNYMCSVTSCALKCLHCGAGYCTACLYSEGGKKMKSLTECAKCKKVPRVQSTTKRSEWKD